MVYLLTELAYYRTLWYGALRKTMDIPDGLFLLPFSSWFDVSPANWIRVPELPSKFAYAVDSGAYRYRQSGYPYQPSDYIAWCQALTPPPLWVVMPDWFGNLSGTYPFPTRAINADMYGPYPGSESVQNLTSPLFLFTDLLASAFGLHDQTSIQQIRTALMAYLLWEQSRESVPVWVPVIQGGPASTSYLWHTRLLLPLIEAMQAYYGPDSMFRVGVGALAGRRADEIATIIACLTAILPVRTRLHLFALSLRDLELFPASMPSSLSEVSIDTSQWNGERIRGKESGRKAWQESGLRQLEYGYAVALPAYEQRLYAAWERLHVHLPAIFTERLLPYSFPFDCVV
jgi:hypothetical protein